jgi:hypothetical protein
VSRFEFLEDWYRSHCDGDREHGWGIELKTLDNPGWWLKVTLEGTELENRTIIRTRRETSPSAWIDYGCDGKTFQLACGPKSLLEA